MMQWEDTVIAELQLRKKKQLKERITITLRGGCVSAAQVPPSFFFKHTLHTQICLDFTQLKIMSQPH